MKRDYPTLTDPFDYRWRQEDRHGQRLWVLYEPVLIRGTGRFGAKSVMVEYPNGDLLCFEPDPVTGEIAGVSVTDGGRLP